MTNKTTAKATSKTTAKRATKSTTKPNAPAQANPDKTPDSQQVSQEQATEIVKKKRRNGFSIQSDFGAAPGENSRFLRFALVSWDLPPIDISDPEQVRNRIGEYFRHCANNDRKPQIVGMCNWLGISRDTLNNWMRGEIRNSTHYDIIKKACNLIEEQWADYMQNGKINPASGIFLAKNWFSYKDQTDVVVAPQNPLDGLNADDARKRIEESIPED